MRCASQPGSVDHDNKDAIPGKQAVAQEDVNGLDKGSRMVRGAKLSDDRLYRYGLWRKWDDRPKVMFIGLNPSTADEVEDDPTIRRCIGFANSWGYGGIVVANLFGFRATDPTALQKATDPIGPENDEWLYRLADEAALVVGAWGNGGLF